jgi:GR25 family glycosyltransferase involved in LPS biosynthesis
VSGGLPPTYLINMDRSTDRLSRFWRRNTHLSGVTRIAAVDGGAVSRDAWEHLGYISSDLSHYKPGAIGCALSHVRLWEAAATIGAAITVLEDDAAVSHHFNRCAPQVLSLLPSDWDFIAWGFNFPPSYVWVDLGVSKAKLMPYGARQYKTDEGVEEFQQKDFAGGPVRLLHAFGTSGYSISALGARKALEYCRPLRSRFITFPEADVRTPDAGIDSALCGLYPSIKAFVCLPPLIVPRATEPSSIREINEAAIAIAPVHQADAISAQRV